MNVQEIPVALIDISEFNTRKNLADGQHDSTIEDLAASIAQNSLLNPITVFPKPDGRFAVVAGQRRTLAVRLLKWETISAIIREDVNETDATALSLTENLHRADMNPRDKARAFKALQEQLGDLISVSRATNISSATIKKYIQLLDLAPQLQDQLAAGEVKNTAALARLATKVKDFETQVRIWERIKGFTQEVQETIIKDLDPNLDNLDELVGKAHEGAFNVHLIRNCPFDCPTIPPAIKERVAQLVAEFGEDDGISRTTSRN